MEKVIGKQQSVIELDEKQKPIGIMITLNPLLVGYYEDIIKGGRSLWHYYLPKEQYFGD